MTTTLLGAGRVRPWSPVQRLFAGTLTDRAGRRVTYPDIVRARLRIHEADAVKKAQRELRRQEARDGAVS